MVESERRRLISSTPQLTPEQVSQQSFPTGFRGYAEGDVRVLEARVRRVGRRPDRESELLDAVDVLEEQLRSPRPLDESQLLDALGAETSRLLRSARETADASAREPRSRRFRRPMRRPAEGPEPAGRGRRVLPGAHRRGRGARDRDRGRGRAERGGDPRRGGGVLDRATAARRPRDRGAGRSRRGQQGRDMLDEAKSTRERVLADLFRRRALLQAQVDELRGGRDHLLDVYRVVKRTFLEATGALAQVEARAAERSATPAGDDDTDALDVAPKPRPTSMRARSRLTMTPLRPTTATRPIRTSPTSTRCSRASAPVRRRPRLPSRPPTPLTRSASPTPPRPMRRSRSRAAPEPETETPVLSPRRCRRRPAPEPTECGRRLAGPAGRGPRSAAGPVAKRAKRAPRTIRTPSSTRSGATRAGRPRLRSSRRNPTLLDGVGRRHPGRDRRRVPRAAHRPPAASRTQRATTSRREVAAVIVLPVRERIAAAIDAGEEGDTGGLVERIGARFREWKNQTLENALADALGDGVVARRVRRVAGRHRAAVDPARRGSLCRLRRQRLGADGQGLDLPDRPDPSSRAPGLSLLAGSGRCSQRPRSERVNGATPTVAARPARNIRPVRVPSGAESSTFDRNSRLADRCRDRCSSCCS